MGIDIGTGMPTNTTGVGGFTRLRPCESRIKKFWWARRCNDCGNSFKIMREIIKGSVTVKFCLGCCFTLADQGYYEYI
jgi:hypothetical protein